MTFKLKQKQHSQQIFWENLTKSMFRLNLKEQFDIKGKYASFISVKGLDKYINIKF